MNLQTSVSYMCKYSNTQLCIVLYTTERNLVHDVMQHVNAAEARIEPKSIPMYTVMFTSYWHVLHHIVNQPLLCTCMYTVCLTMYKIYSTGV